MTQASRLLGRIAALFILAALLGLLHVEAAAPLLGSYRERAERTESLQDQLRRYQREAALLPARRAALQALQSRKTAGDGFLDGPSDTLVAVKIQNHLKAVAEDAKAELRSAEVLPAVDEEGLRRIAIRARLSTTLSGAERILYTLETGSPFLFIDDLDLRVSPQNLRDLGEETGGIMDLDLEVYGYARPSKDGEK